MKLAEALRTMDKGPFSIRYVSLDRTRRTGGKMCYMERAVRCGAKHSLQRNRQIAIRDAGGKGHPVPVHLMLITRVNNEPVI